MAKLHGEAWGKRGSEKKGGLAASTTEIFKLLITHALVSQRRTGPGTAGIMEWSRVGDPLHKDSLMRALLP